jgi:flagellar biosynthesis protein FliR
VLARVTPLTVLGPFFLLRPAPPLVRAGVALMLSAALMPLAYAHARFAFAPHSLPLLLGVEVLRGALFAFAVALPLMALEGTGQWLDALRGAQHGGSPGALFGGQITPLGTLLGLLSVALFFAFGGHRVALSAFAAGFELVPVGAPMPAEAWPALAERSTRWVAAALAVTVSVGAPTALAIALVELSMGLMGRTAPQLPLHFAGMPLRAAVGLVGLLLTVSVLVPHLPDLIVSGIDEGRTALPLTHTP